MSDFYLFAGENYYPDGGAEDFIGVFENFESAEKTLFNTFSVKRWGGDYDLEWAHIADSRHRIIKKYKRDPFGALSGWIEDDYS